MRKIILGYEKLSTPHPHKGWNFNGRYEPCTDQLDDEQVEALGHYEQFVYKNVVAPERFPASHRPIFSDAQSKHLTEWERRLSTDISDETYFYPIEVLNMPAYARYTSHISINPKALTDMREGRAYLIFTYLHEGNLSLYEHPLARFCRLVSELDIPKRQVIMFHGDQSVENYKDMPFTYCPANGIYMWLSHHKNRPLVDYTPEKLFVTYARNPSYHRILLLKKLRDGGLIERGIYSLGDITREQLTYFNNTYLNNALTIDDTEFFLSIRNTSPDNKDFERDGCQTQIPPEHYQSTAVSILSETLPDTVFFSEKTYKPIVAGHPFIVLSGKGQLARMKELGFKTFSDWWDESYDMCPRLEERIEKIVDIIQMLGRKPPQELTQMRTEMKEVLTHNQSLFNKLISNPYGPHLDIAEHLLMKVNNT